MGSSADDVDSFAGDSEVLFLLSSGLFGYLVGRELFDVIAFVLLAATVALAKLAWLHKTVERAEGELAVANTALLLVEAVAAPRVRGKFRRRSH